MTLSNVPLEGYLIQVLMYYLYIYGMQKCPLNRFKQYMYGFDTTLVGHQR
ncbi:hypothetical protein [uncultured Gammaproteobacteria bacterium]|jgi:hypothetical protein|nr:hypothetical protein [uncultured Gammaproteobacteria bacterium]